MNALTKQEMMAKILRKLSSESSHQVIDSSKELHKVSNQIAQDVNNMNRTFSSAKYPQEKNK